MNDDSGVVALGNRRRQTEDHAYAAIQWLNGCGTYGATWKEMARALDLHHGQASGRLSSLHRAGKIARLRDVKRQRCKVYVGLNFIGGRPTDDSRPWRLVDELAECLGTIPDAALREAGGTWRAERQALLDRYVDRRG